MQDRKRDKALDFAGEERWILCATSALTDYTIENRELMDGKCGKMSIDNVS